MYSGIDDDLVEYFVEARDKADCAVDHSAVVKDPQRRSLSLNRPNVRVWTQQNVLELRLFLVDLLDGLCVLGGLLVSEGVGVLVVSENIGVLLRLLCWLLAVVGKHRAWLRFRRHFADVKARPKGASPEQQNCNLLFLGQFCRVERFKCLLKLLKFNLLKSKYSSKVLYQSLAGVTAVCPRFHFFNPFFFELFANSNDNSPFCR